jgi:23S rRNA (uracil1939-C5)-methyltransferase
MSIQFEKNEELMFTIKKIGINGEGIGYYKRKAVFVDGAIPPEEVVVKITQDKKTYAVGELIRIKKKSAHRVKPFCKYYNECGGCQLQHLEYNEQLNQKTFMLYEAFERYTKINLETITKKPMIFSKYEKGYRYKLQMPVKNTHFGLRAGLYKKNSNDLVDILKCPIQNDDINLTLQKVLELCTEYDINAFDPLTKRGLLRYVVIRQSKHSKEIQVTLIITIYNKALKDAAKKIIELPNVKTVAISKNHDVRNHEIFGEEVEILEGSKYIKESIDGIEYELSPKAFYQLNPEQAKLLYKTVKDLLTEKNQNIVDAYGGSGTIGLYIADIAKDVLGIDVSKESVYAARHNIKKNGIKNVRYEIGTVFDVLAKERLRGWIPDTLIIDPPRSGMDQETIKILLKLKIKTIIYVSCNPSTLAKNIDRLAQSYKVISVQPIDMFPHTSHVESITLLELK